MYAIYAAIGAIVGFLLALWLIYNSILYVQRRKK